MRDQLCDVISCACSCEIGETSVHIKVVIENSKKQKRWRVENFSWIFI